MEAPRLQKGKRRQSLVPDGAQSPKRKKMRLEKSSDSVNGNAMEVADSAASSASNRAADDEGDLKAVFEKVVREAEYPFIYLLSHFYRPNSVLLFIFYKFMSFMLGFSFVGAAYWTNSRPTRSRSQLRSPPTTSFLISPVLPSLLL